MAAFDYATASPLVADVLAKQTTLIGAGGTLLGAIETSACASTISVMQTAAALEDMVTAVTALSDYIATLAPE